MTDEEFLGYVEIHSETERALFHRDQILRLLQLADGVERLVGDLPEWVTLRAPDAHAIVARARARAAPAPDLRRATGALADRICAAVNAFSAEAARAKDRSWLKQLQCALLAIFVRVAREADLSDDQILNHVRDHLQADRELELETAGDEN